MRYSNDAKSCIIVLLRRKTIAVRKLRLLLAVVLSPLLAGAQDLQINEGKEEMSKSERWCFSATYPYKKEVAEAVMDKNLEQAHMERSAHKKGVSTYKAATWPQISDSKCDYYYKMKGKKSRTTLFLCVSKGYDNYVTSSNDVTTANNIKQYMLHLQDQMKTAVEIEQEEAKLKKMAEKNDAAKEKLEESQKEQAAKEEKLKALKRKR